MGVYLTSVQVADRWINKQYNLPIKFPRNLKYMK